jgi:hypothetical protein
MLHSSPGGRSSLKHSLISLQNGRIQIREVLMRSRSQKVWSLKDFEIHAVLEKEPLRNGQKLLTCLVQSFARSKEGKF